VKGHIGQDRRGIRGQAWERHRIPADPDDPAAHTGGARVSGEEVVVVVGAGRSPARPNPCHGRPGDGVGEGHPHHEGEAGGRREQPRRQAYVLGVPNGPVQG
jgi:hypothetical protein